jgi:hypothetical protein
VQSWTNTWWLSWLASWPTGGCVSLSVFLYRSLSLYLSRVPSALKIRKQIECKCNNTDSNEVRRSQLGCVAWRTHLVACQDDLLADWLCVSLYISLSLSCASCLIDSKADWMQMSNYRFKWRREETTLKCVWLMCLMVVCECVFLFIISSVSHALYISFLLSPHRLNGTYSTIQTRSAWLPCASSVIKIQSGKTKYNPLLALPLSAKA